MPTPESGEEARIERPRFQHFGCKNPDTYYGANRGAAALGGLGLFRGFWGGFSVERAEAEGTRHPDLQSVPPP